jgi:hypothetical protein
MSKDERTIVIKAYKDGSAPDGYRFEMLPTGKPHTTTLTFNKDHDGMKKSQKYKVKFSLMNDNATGADLRFIRDDKEVMWVSKGTPTDPGPCPVVTIHDPEFEVKTVEDYYLEITNKDDAICQYKFVLNFVGVNSAGKTALIPFDPIWDNKNGGDDRADSWLGGILILGLACGAALGGLGAYLALQP